ncbi:MAG: WecB/TagA/CpsF family glycosyltransferase [Brevinemataceae bacterium]
MQFSEFYIFGVKLTDISRNEWRNYLYNKLYHSQYARIIILTEKKLFQALFNRELMETINQADIVLSSSSLISWFAYHIHGRIIKPALAVTYFLDVLTVASECHSTVSFFGSTKEILFLTVKKVAKSFLGIRIVSHYPQNIPLKEQGKVFIALRKSAAKLGLFNLGNGQYQELWINKNYEIFKKGVTIGVDDSFEIISGKKSVPSLAMQEKGWLGLHALMMNPLNIAKMFRCVILVCYYFLTKLFMKK